MNASIVLTVAQSKRLIGKAVAQMPAVKKALTEGIVAIGRGTTNGYIAEEILGHVIPKREYVAGRTLPPGVPWEKLGRGDYPDIVLKQGQQVENATVVGVVEQMGSGDVFIKGANAVNYAQQVAGVLVGHPMGGTVSVYGALVSRKVHLIIPVGLEKLVYEDINSLSVASRDADIHPKSNVVSLFPLTGTIVTEIEALEILCDVDAELLAAGGVMGAEGAVWLLLSGDQASLDRALALYEQLKDERNIGD